MLYVYVYPSVTGEYPSSEYLRRRIPEHFAHFPREATQEVVIQFVSERPLFAKMDAYGFVSSTNPLQQN